jgi:hypothetical protein
MKTLDQILIDLGACEGARVWAKGKTIEEVINTCHRGDWLLWLAKKVDVDFRLLTLAKGHCAATVLHLMKDELSRKAVEVAIRYGEGNATDAELRAADAAAYAADAAAYAADAAAYAADAAAYAAAKQANQKATADICRKYLTEAIIEKIKAL